MHSKRKYKLHLAHIQTRIIFPQAFTLERNGCAFIIKSSRKKKQKVVNEYRKKTC